MGKGILDFEYTKDKIKPHGNTWRMLIIGPSNSGKTTLFTNSIPFFPRPINSISYIGPTSTLEDEAPKKLAMILKKTGINWNPINVDTESFIEIADVEKPEIVVFDDVYKLKKLEPYVDSVFIRGRHNGQHAVYITQTPAFVPSSVRNNYTWLVLHSSLLNEDVEKKFAFPKGTLTSLELDEPGFITIYKNTGEIQRYQPPVYKNTSNVYAVFKKIPHHSIKPVSTREAAATRQGIRDAGNDNAMEPAPRPQKIIDDRGGDQIGPPSYIPLFFRPKRGLFVK